MSLIETKDNYLRFMQSVKTKNLGAVEMLTDTKEERIEALEQKIKEFVNLEERLYDMVRQILKGATIYSEIQL